MAPRLGPPITMFQVVSSINRKSVHTSTANPSTFARLFSPGQTTTGRFSSASSTSASVSPAPIVELRQYHLHPSKTALYTQSTVKSSNLRRSHLPLAFFGYPETGSIPLNTAVHLYNYQGGHPQRLEHRTKLAQIVEWKQYLGEVKECMIQQSSSIFTEAGFLKDFEAVRGLGNWTSSEVNTIESHSPSTSIIELRKYQLQLGYDTVPKFIQQYSQALSSKLNAVGTHPTTELVTVLVSDVGSLNCVLEIWKHGGCIGNCENVESYCGIAAMEQSRQASRGAAEWRQGIAEIAKVAVTFQSTVLKPLEFSPLK